MEAPRRQIWFDNPDEAYLVSAALARHLDASIVSDVILVPTADHGPALQVSAAAAGDRLVQALVRRFGGHIDGEAVAARVREVTGD
jgi:hypothetical protein